MKDKWEEEFERFAKAFRRLQFARWQQKFIRKLMSGMISHSWSADRLAANQSDANDEARELVKGWPDPWE